MDVLFRKSDIDKDLMVINHIVLLGILSIGVSLIIQNHSQKFLKAKLKATLSIEFYIVGEKGKLVQH